MTKKKLEINSISKKLASTNIETGYTYALISGILIICIFAKYKIFVIPISIFIIYFLLRLTYFWIDFFQDYFIYNEPLKNIRVKLEYKNVSYVEIISRPLSSQAGSLFFINIYLNEKTNNISELVGFGINSTQIYKDIFLNKSIKIVIK